MWVVIPPRHRVRSSLRSVLHAGADTGSTIVRDFSALRISALWHRTQNGTERAGNDGGVLLFTERNNQRVSVTLTPSHTSRITPPRVTLSARTGLLWTPNKTWVHFRTSDNILALWYFIHPSCIWQSAR